MHYRELLPVIEKIRQDGDGQFGPSMLDVEKLIDYANAAHNNLLWMSGSTDFSQGGKAHDAFVREVKPLL